jgi:hypothetical protein
VVGTGHGEFGPILEALDPQLEVRPQQRDWNDRTLFVARI